MASSDDALEYWPENISEQEKEYISQHRREKWTNDNATELFIKYFSPLLSKEHIERLRKMGR